MRALERQVASWQVLWGQLRQRESVNGCHWHARLCYLHVATMSSAGRTWIS